MAKYDFWKRVISSKDPSSAKRLVTLVMAAHFIVTSFLVSFFAFYMILYIPRGSVNKDLLELLDKILDNDIMVILGGLTIIGAENLAQMWLERIKAKVAGNVQVGAPTADTINVDTVNVDQKLKTQEE